MSEGHVYILSNPSMPGLVKIGRTSRGVSARAAELQQTGVPLPFTVHTSVLSPDCAELEMRMHEHFQKYRVAENREFFRADVERVHSVLNVALRAQISEVVDRYDPALAVCDAFARIDEDVAYRLQQDIGAHFHEIGCILDELHPEDLKPAIARYQEKCRLRGMRLDAGIGIGSLDIDDIKREIAEKEAQSVDLKVVS